MPTLSRLLLIVVLCLVGAAPAPAQVPSPSSTERPFVAMADIWSRALDRIAQEVTRPNLIDTEVEQLRSETTAIRQAAAIAAGQARNEATALRTLLVPLEARPDRGVLAPDGKAPREKPPDQAPEPEAVKQQRDRLRGDLALVDARVKQAELIIARADLLIAQLAKVRSDQFARTVLKRGPSPLLPSTWMRLGGDLAAAWTAQTASWSALLSSGELTKALHDTERRSRTVASIAGLLAAWLGLAWLRRRYGRTEAIAEPSYRDRAIAAGLDGVGMVGLPVLAVLLILSWLPAPETSAAPLRPALGTLASIAHNAIFFLIVYGLSQSSLTPAYPAWRLLPFAADSATAFCARIQRLAGFVAITGPASAFLLLQLPGGTDDVQGLASIVGLVIALGLLVLGVPALKSDAWRSSVAAGDGTVPLIGGYSWLLCRLALGVVLVCIAGAAVLGYTALAIHASDSLLDSVMVVFLAIVAHALVHDVVEAAGAPDTPPGRWLRRVFGLAPDAAIHGRYVLVLLVDLVLLAGVGVILPIVWGADPDDILDKANRLVSGFSIGQHRISPVDIGIALLVFAASIAIVRFARGALRDRFLPSLHMQDDIRLSIDAMVNYVGIVVAVLLAISALGIDFTNLALIVGALSVGIGLGLQNLANNTISGVVLLLERPIKVGDRVVVGRHEGIVRRINVRATEIETGQRAVVIVPNSEFLQSAVVNWTYADNVGRIDVPVTVVHGSDPGKVEAILRQAAEENAYVVGVPRPVVMFKTIAATGLEFELRAHVDNVANTIAAQNMLNGAILAKLAEAGIAVASTLPAVPPPPRPAAATPEPA
jgi:small-conductance mechanosensitive channel